MNAPVLSLWRRRPRIGTFLRLLERKKEKHGGFLPRFFRGGPRASLERFRYWNGNRGDRGIFLKLPHQADAERKRRKKDGTAVRQRTSVRIARISSVDVQIQLSSAFQRHGTFLKIFCARAGERRFTSLKGEWMMIRSADLIRRGGEKHSGPVRGNSGAARPPIDIEAD